MADAVQEGGANLDKAGPTIQKSAANAVSKPILPSAKKKSARARVKAPVRKHKRSAAVAKKKGAAKKKHR
jgi:hypothetical protein